MSNELAGKKCILLGAGSIAPGWGIGKALAVSFAREGAELVVCDQNIESARETQKIITDEGGKAHALQVDVGDENQLTDVITKAMEILEGIDILYNNVGASIPGPSESLSAADWRRVSDVNVLSLHIASQTVLPHMRSQKKGVVLTTSTIAALRHMGHPHLIYGVTKAAVLHFSRMMAVEYAPDGIRFNCIVPGLIDTPRIRVTLTKSYKAVHGCTEEEMIEKRNKQVPLGFMGDAWDVANAAVFLASDKARYITGTELIIDGGVTLTLKQ